MYVCICDLFVTNAFNQLDIIHKGRAVAVGAGVCRYKYTQANSDLVCTVKLHRVLCPRGLGVGIGCVLGRGVEHICGVHNDLLPVFHPKANGVIGVLVDCHVLISLSHAAAIELQ